MDVLQRLKYLLYLKRQYMDHCAAFNAYAFRRLAKQATEGPNKEERPMWAEKGGIDFDGRSRCPPKLISVLLPTLVVFQQGTCMVSGKRDD